MLFGWDCDMARSSKQTSVFYRIILFVWKTSVRSFAGKLWHGCLFVCFFDKLKQCSDFCFTFVNWEWKLSGLDVTLTWNQGLREKFYQGIRRPISVPLASGSPVETSIPCWYSNRNIDKAVTIPRFTNKLIVIVATSPVATRGHSGVMPSKFLLCAPKFCWAQKNLF